MNTVRVRGESVRRFIIANVEKHPSDIVKITAEKFSCTRQAVHRHLGRLVEEGALLQQGQTRSKTYHLAPLVSWKKLYQRDSALAEDRIWLADVAPSFAKMPENVLWIWHYGFTEMFNNAIDHSGATIIGVSFSKTAASTKMQIYDNGVGIFRKIQGSLGLIDERHAVLELAKGKFTTDPTRHSGQGIFFSSRMFDQFWIMSGDVYFSHQFDKKEDWIVQSSSSLPESVPSGTLISMTLNNHSARTAKKVFDAYSTDEDYGFTKTIVPVTLAQYGDDNLISRSQAKRLLARIDCFKIVVLDFRGVAAIGQAFADEVFRVFTKMHPEVEITAVNTSSEVKKMISRAGASM